MNEYDRFLRGFNLTKRTQTICTNHNRDQRFSSEWSKVLSRRADGRPGNIYSDGQINERMFKFALWFKMATIFFVKHLFNGGHSAIYMFLYLGFNYKLSNKDIKIHSVFCFIYILINNVTAKVFCSIWCWLNQARITPLVVILPVSYFCSSEPTFIKLMYNV